MPVQFISSFDFHSRFNDKISINFYLFNIASANITIVSRDTPNANGYGLHTLQPMCLRIKQFSVFSGMKCLQKNLIFICSLFLLDQRWLLSCFKIHKKRKKNWNALTRLRNWSLMWFFQSWFLWDNKILLVLKKWFFSRWYKVRNTSTVVNVDRNEFYGIWRWWEFFTSFFGWYR